MIIHHKILKFLVEDVELLTSKEFELEDYCVIALDCGDKNRICLNDTLINNAKHLTCIDHHASNDYSGDLNYIDADASSTCELVYNLLVRA